MDELLGTSAADYARFGLAVDSIAAWEDGARTDNRPGTYEWWYFDAHLNDGATIVVAFMNKPMASAGGPLSPSLRLAMTLPDGRSVQKVVPFRPEQWSAATDHADVRLGENRFRGDLREYRIQATAGDVSVDLTLRGETPSWRPATGHLVYGKRREQTFAWLPSVPQGRVTGSYTVDGQTHDASGTGYHDHNWGNVPLHRIVHNWYWARGQAGPYTVIAAHITATKRYHYKPVTVFMLARDGRIVGDDGSLVRFETDGVYTDAQTGKPVAATTRYNYERGDERVVVSFERERDIAVTKLIDDMTGWKKAAARLARFDGATLRFAGPMTVTVYRAGNEVERHTDQAIWDLVYIGPTLRGHNALRAATPHRLSQRR
jgi:hypothetical protein